MSVAHPNVRVGRRRVLRIVTLASESGKYGGPTDTAVRQARLLNSPAQQVRVVAASFKGDAPDSPLLTTATASSLLGLKGYSLVFSSRVAALVGRSVRGSDLVHISIARELVPVVATVLALMMRKPIVLQPHGMLTARTSSAHRLIDAFLRPLVRRAQVLIALTEIERRALVDWFGRGAHPPIFVVGNPSPDLERRPVTGPRIVFFAARLHPRKRVGDFVDAARESHARGENLLWVVAGPDQGELVKVEAALPATPNLTYVGALSPAQVDEWLSQASVFVLPSRDEPWGNVVATAIKAQVPVVVTRSSAIADEVQGLNAGVVVSDESPEEIAAAVTALLDFAPPSSREHAKALQVRFGNDGIAASLEQAYDSAIRRRRASRAPWGGHS